MFVACSTRCFSKEPLESALRHMAELEFDKFDLALVEAGGGLRPSEVAANPDAALARIRQGPSLIPAALELDPGPEDPADPKAWRRTFDAMCRFAKQLTVAVLTIPASPLGTPFDDEVRRLTALAEHATAQGLVLTVLTHSETLTAEPDGAIALCEAVPGLGLTLDPSHYVQGPNKGESYDAVYPYVKHVHFRDTGKKPGEFQVRVGQGALEYTRIVPLLQRHGYDRGLTVAIRDDLDSPFDVEAEVRKLKYLLESLL